MTHLFVSPEFGAVGYLTIGTLKTIHNGLKVTSDTCKIVDMPLSGCETLGSRIRLGRRDPVVKRVRFGPEMKSGEPYPAFSA